MKLKMTRKILACLTATSNGCFYFKFEDREKHSPSDQLHVKNEGFIQNYLTPFCTDLAYLFEKGDSNAF